MSKTEPVGYFAWVKGFKGIPSPVKYPADYEQGLQNITRKLHNESLVPGSKKPLNAAHWRLSLDELSTLYPLENSAEKSL